MLSRYTDRLRELYWVCIAKETALSSFQQEAPLLESLDLFFDRTGVDLDHGLHVPLFQNKAPHLHQLALENVISWTTNSFTNLSGLSIRGLGGSSTIATRADYSNLLQILRSSPHLEDLVLSILRPWIDSHGFREPTAVKEQVKLHALRRFCLTNSTEEHAAHLLSDLVLPDNLCVSILDVGGTFAHSDPEDHRASGMFSVLPDDLSQHSSWTNVTTLEI